jgi:TPR repeat protein
MKAILLVTLAASLLGATRLPAAGPVPAAAPRADPDSPAAAAIAAYRDGRSNAALELARPLAAQGNAGALFLMGLLLDSTREPLRLSRGQAMIHYYRQAEAAGHSEAAARRLLTSGQKSEREAAIASLEAAAAGGDVRATRVLGEAWLRGFVNGKSEPDKTIHLWTTAGNAGDTSSLILLGKLHAGHFHSPPRQDPAAAIECYRRAAKLTDRDAYIPLGALLLAANDHEGYTWLDRALASNLPQANLILGDHELEVRGNRKAALDHYLKGALAGNTPCMHRVAKLLLGSPASSAEGLAWLRKAADAGDPEGAADFGQHLSNQTPPDYPSARIYLTTAALEGIAKAQYQLALFHLEGKGTPADPVAAVAWLTEAMKAGDPEAQFELATLHEQGVGTPVNYANAGVLYTLACNKGHAAAAARIARMAADGRGTEASTTRAWAYAALAAERHDADGKTLLAELETKLTPAEKPLAAKVLAELRMSAKAPVPLPNADTASP